MIAQIVEMSCDYPLCDEVTGPETFVGALRRRAKAEGWKSVYRKDNYQKSDFCPNHRSQAYANFDSALEPVSPGAAKGLTE